VILANETKWSGNFAVLDDIPMVVGDRKFTIPVALPIGETTTLGLVSGLENATE